ncbi:MAG: PAS domain-containing protein [Deltaproteobacteria bacterium]|nr:PAS domain-containing protein [Deltaproteobacteria bacterium]MBW1793210.1 PAS domain-containing protein [Deltaproteobacteria bacterium]MBW2331074.1 PAS domain-containing protein [Deltaproteobacteria bacterium]
MTLDNTRKKKLSIGIIGGGKRCKTILEMSQRERPPKVNASVVIVFDPDPESPGYQYASELGIETTTDLEAFSERKDLNFILDLTGARKVLIPLLVHKGSKVPVLDAVSSNLLYDVFNIQKELITTRRSLRQTKTFLERVINSIQEEILVIDTNFKIVDANDAALKAVSLTKEEVVGKYCYQICYQSQTPCNSKDHPCPMQDVLRTGNYSQATHKRHKSDGEARYYDLVLYPLKDENGNVAQVIEIGRDISDELEKRVAGRAKELKEDYARLVQEDKMISLGKLMSSVAHEINNPLSGIINLSKLVLRNLEEEALDEESLDTMKQHLGLVVSETTRTSKIVSNLLSFSRQVKVDVQNIDINEVIHRVFSIVGHKAKLQDIAVHFELDEPLLTVKGNFAQLQQSIMNIVFNAIEAMPDGGELTISTRHRDAKKHEVVVDILDTGHGISQKNLPNIFEPFFSTKGEAKGVGLGLSVVYGIIRDHQGEITVKSEVGKGTDFTIRLPAQERETSRSYGRG